jgi:hypothetical protein
MTTLTLNLLAEEQLAKQAEARDPFKVAVAAGLGLCLICVMIGTVVGQFASSKSKQANALQAKLDALTAKSFGSGGDTKSFRATAEEILAINRSRRLYAQQLALIKDVVPDSIQLERISFALSTETAVAPPSDVDAGGKEASSAKAARARRPNSTERMTLRLDGKSVGSRPEMEVDQFIQTMTTHELFSKNFKEVKLRSIARNTPTKEQGTPEAPNASFVVECQYKDRQ